MTSRIPVDLDGWPGDCDPRDRAWVFAHNETVVASNPEDLWERLVLAERWPRWYSNARFVKTVDDKPLTLGVEFTWLTFGLPIESVVTHFDKPYSLGWCWKSRGWAGAAWGYHGWRLEKLAVGTRVVTEEAQRGFIPWALRPMLRPMLHAGHQLWLHDLAKPAEF